MAVCAYESGRCFDVGPFESDGELAGFDVAIFTYCDAVKTDNGVRIQHYQLDFCLHNLTYGYNSFDWL